MKRFLLFAYDEYYPRGGWHDFVGSYASLVEARNRALFVRSEHWQIVDLETETEVEGTPNN